MSLTNAKEFITFHSMMPKELRGNVWFFPLRANKKTPDVPPNTVLKGNLAYRLSYEESVNRLKWGSNVGIYALQQGLMFLDLDVSNGKLLASDRFLDALESNVTLTVKSRNGGLQYYFLNDGKYPNQILKENDITIGELRTDWYYVVSVGSHVEPDLNCCGEPDGTYRIIKECPISEFKPFGEFFRLNGEPKTEQTKTFSERTKCLIERPAEEFRKKYEEKLKGKQLLTDSSKRILKSRCKHEF